MNQKFKKRSQTDEAIAQLLNEALVNIGITLSFLATVSSKILWKGLKRLKLVSALLSLSGLLFISWFLAKHDYHLHFLHWINADIFSYALLVKIKSYGFKENVLALTGLFSLSILFFMGIIPVIRLHRYQKALDDVSLKNAQDFKAKIIDAWMEDDYHKVVKVMVPGIGAEGLRKVQGKLEASFGIPIEEIRTCPNPKFAEIILGGRELPSMLPFCEIDKDLNGRPGSFLIGESKKGVLRGKISDLPHLLVAGTTGGGKSLFFKQALLGLLHSWDSLQMYLIDLKGGLEFRAFAFLPNVKLVKNIEEAVALLQAIKVEMESRFDYLEESGRDKIVPEHDKCDPIIVGIDEASVLYASASRDSEDYALIVKARSLTEHIAKLSRAADIHLILATQKVTKETIDTRIQENISGRMCFKLNTLEGSIRVLGNTQAHGLPGIPGRGIWQHGNKQVEVQTPYLDTGTLKEKLAEVNDVYTRQEKILRQEMLNLD